MDHRFNLKWLITNRVTCMIHNEWDEWDIFTSLAENVIFEVWFLCKRVLTPAQLIDRIQHCLRKKGDIFLTVYDLISKCLKSILKSSSKVFESYWPFIYKERDCLIPNSISGNLNLIGNVEETDIIIFYFNSDNISSLFLYQ